MAKKKVHHKNASAGTLTSATATAGDVVVAAGLPPTEATPVRSVSSAYVTLLADEKLQASIEKLAPQLKAFRDFKGQNVSQAIALANEGATLVGVADRSENAVARVHARNVQINAALGPFITALGRCAAAADPDSEIATALSAFATSLVAQRGIAKRARTLGKKKKTPATAG